VCKITSGLCVAGDLFIQAISIKISPGKTKRYFNVMSITSTNTANAQAPT
jgi:hypothetical protein